MVSAVAVDEKRLMEEFSEMIKQELSVFKVKWGRKESFLAWNAAFEDEDPNSLRWKTKIWLVDDAKKMTLVKDALRFYHDIGGMHLQPEVRKAAALQLSFENNKVARTMESIRHVSEAVSKAREHAEVRRMDVTECIDSQLDFIIKAGILDKVEASKLSKVAKEAVERYAEKTKPVSIGSPITMSAAAIYYASYKIGKRITQKNLEPIVDVSNLTIRNRSDELVQVAFPEEFEEWKALKQH